MNHFPNFYLLESSNTFIQISILIHSNRPPKIQNSNSNSFSTFSPVRDVTHSSFSLISPPQQQAHSASSPTGHLRVGVLWLYASHSRKRKEVKIRLHLLLPRAAAAAALMPPATSLRVGMRCHLTPPPLFPS
jgi:hypothetical protein